MLQLWAWGGSINIIDHMLTYLIVTVVIHPFYLYTKLIFN